MSKKNRTKVANSPPSSDNSESLNRSSHELLRMVEALVFASGTPVSKKDIVDYLPQGTDFEALMVQLCNIYAGRGVNLVKSGDSWAFRTADDLSFLLQKEVVENKKLSRAALETLAIIAYHQPVTRAEIEEIRGVAVSRGTLDTLLQTGWIRLRGRRRVVGRPATYGITDDFLSHFGLETPGDLPGFEELKGAGLLQPQLPTNFSMSLSDDNPELDTDKESIVARGY